MAVAAIAASYKPYVPAYLPAYAALWLLKWSGESRHMDTYIVGHGNGCSAHCRYGTAAYGKQSDKRPCTYGHRSLGRNNGRTLYRHVCMDGCWRGIRHRHRCGSLYAYAVRSRPGLCLATFFPLHSCQILSHSGYLLYARHFCTVDNNGICPGLRIKPNVAGMVYLLN